MASASQLRDRALFYRQLATVLGAGLTPIEAVATLSRDRGGAGRRAEEVSELLRDPNVDLAQALAAGETDPLLVRKPHTGQSRWKTCSRGCSRPTCQFPTRAVRDLLSRARRPLP